MEQQLEHDFNEHEHPNMDFEDGLSPICLNFMWRHWRVGPTINLVHFQIYLFLEVLL